MHEDTKTLARLFREVRTCFHQLKSLSDLLIRDLGINPSMRAVMESLASGKKQTVPEMAAARGVSRQHIQKIVNELLELKLVQSEINPAHKRSDYYLLTPRGEDIFSEVVAREAVPMTALTEVLPEADVAAATKALSQLNEAIAALISKGDVK